MPARTYVFLVRFLARGLQAGRKEYKWDVAIPSIPVAIQREQSRFSPPKFVALKRLRLIESLFIDSLKEFTDLTCMQRLGKLLLSAILFGGLVRKRWLVPWLNALRGGIRVYGACLWMDMEIVWQPEREKREEQGPDSRKRSAEKAIIMKRRWIADPLTRLLIVNWLNLPEQMRELPARFGNQYDYIRSYLKHSGGPRTDIPKSLSELLEMVETRLGLTVSSFLASYAAGRINAVSVPAECWARLQTGKAVSRAPAGSVREVFDDRTRLQDKKEATKEKPWPLSAQKSLLGELRGIIYGKRGVNSGNRFIRRKLDLFLRENEQNICPLLRYLTEWSSSLLSSKGGNRPSTVYRYLTAIGNYLLLLCGNDEIINFEPSEFEETYDKVVELIRSDKEKNFVRIPLAGFHMFLVSGYHVSRLSNGLLGRRSGPPETSVDANLVSQLEFDRLKSVLGWDNPARTRTATAALLTAILGFRCGLRRNEVRFLRIRDVQGRHMPELLLRTTSQRRLKSISSTRRLPLYVLLPADELRLLMEWVEQHEKGGDKALVFSLPDDRYTAFPESMIFSPITSGLAQVTGDSSLRHHHLRHSFATWLLVRLTGMATGLHMAAPFLDHPEFSDSRVAELRAQLLGNEHLGRKGAYAVACLCGHADLGTTFTSYIHICDWLLCRELSFKESVPFNNVKLLSEAAGTSRPTAYRWISAHDKEMQNDWDLIFRKCFRSKGRCVDPYVAAARKPDTELIVFAEEEETGHCFWERVQQALTLYQEDGATIEEISIKLGVGEESVKSWTHNASRLADMKTRETETRDKSKKTSCFRHHDSKRPNFQTGRIVFPSVPVALQDRVQAARFLDAFSRLGSAAQREVFINVEYFTECYIRSSNMLVFNQPGKARRFVNAARAIGVNDVMLRLLEFPVAGMSAEERQSRRLFWEKQLKLPGCLWGKGNKNYGRKSDNGTIGIQVTGRMKENVREGGYSKNCFLYACYMIDVARSSFLRHFPDAVPDEEVMEDQPLNE